MTELTPEDVIKRIAEIANDVAWQAGVGGLELAGQFISVLAAHPEKIADFMASNMSIVDDDTLLHAENGCLTWHTKSGTVISPEGFKAANQKKEPAHG